MICRKIEALQKVFEESEAASYRAISTDVNYLLIKLEINKNFDLIKSIAARVLEKRSIWTCASFFDPPSWKNQVLFGRKLDGDLRLMGLSRKTWPHISSHPQLPPIW